MSITITNPNNLPAMLQLIFANFNIPADKRAKFADNNKFNYPDFFEKYFCNPEINFQNSSGYTLQKIYETFKDYTKYKLGKSSLYQLFLDLNAESNIKKIQQDEQFGDKWKTLGNFFNDIVIAYNNSIANTDKKGAIQKMRNALLNNNIQLGNNKIGPFSNISMMQLCQVFADLYMNYPEVINKYEGAEKYNSIEEKWDNCLHLERVYNDIIKELTNKMDDSSNIKPVDKGGLIYFLGTEKDTHSLLKAAKTSEYNEYIQEIISIPIKWKDDGNKTTIQEVYINKLSQNQQSQVLSFFGEIYMNIPSMKDFIHDVVELTTVMENDDQTHSVSI